jgi:hypothetical protein
MPDRHCPEPAMGNASRFDAAVAQGQEASVTWERRGAERAQAERSPTAAPGRGVRCPLASRERRHHSLTRLPRSGEARAWGRPTARTSAKREEHRRVGATSPPRPAAVGGLRDPSGARSVTRRSRARSIDAASARARDRAGWSGVRRGAERAPRSGARPPRRAEAPDVRSPHASDATVQEWTPPRKSVLRRFWGGSEEALS